MPKKNIAKVLKEFTYKTRLESAEKLRDKLLKMMGNYLKAVILFGSMARGDVKPTSDIDLYLIFDDTKFPIGKFNEVREKIDDDVKKAARSIDPRISVQPVIALTEFWDGIRNCHPLFYTIVRDGFAIYDAGFFIPLRKLLEWGKFPATAEAAERMMEGVSGRITRVKSVKVYMVVEDLFYAAANSAQAILMYMGVPPPAPKFIGRDLRKYVVSAGLLEAEWADFYDKIYDLRKKVEDKKISEISGKELDEWIENTEKFVSKMEGILARLSLAKRAEEIKTNYEMMIKGTIAVLKKLEKLPPDPKDVPEAFVKYIVEAGIVPMKYFDVFNNVVYMRKLVDENKVNEIKERDIYTTREYVRRFFNTIKPIIEAKPEELQKILKEAEERKKEIEKIEAAEKAKLSEATAKLGSAKAVSKLQDIGPACAVDKEAEKKLEKIEKKIEAPIREAKVEEKASEEKKAEGPAKEKEKKKPAAKK